jgi:hypothetical protein
MKWLIRWKSRRWLNRIWKHPLTWFERDYDRTGSIVWNKFVNISDIFLQTLTQKLQASNLSGSYRRSKLRDFVSE